MVKVESHKINNGACLAHVFTQRIILVLEYGKLDLDNLRSNLAKYQMGIKSIQKE